MEIKYTIEILTKDIQDIEKLVGNMGNSKDASAIELDLALSKLRNVYDILTLIKADRLHELTTAARMKENHLEKQEPPQEAPASVQKGPEKETPAAAQAEPEKETPAAAQAGPENEAPAPARNKSASSILAEKFTAGESINENLAEKRSGDAEGKPLGQAIDNIGRNIGINDRFLIIRELFEGEKERFTSLVSELDKAENYEAANQILKQQFGDQMDHEGVGILTGLLKRRYIR